MLKKFSQFINESHFEDEPFKYDEPSPRLIKRGFDRSKAKALLAELSERSIEELRDMCMQTIDRSAPGPMDEAFGMYHADREGSDVEALMELTAMVTDADSASQMLALIDMF